MKLTSEDRENLAEELRGSIDSPATTAAAWDEEIVRRLAQLDAGEVETLPVEEVIAELRARLE